MLSFSLLHPYQTSQFLTRPVSFVVATIVLTVLLIGCGSEDAPGVSVSTEQSAPQAVENKVAMVATPAQLPNNQATPTQPVSDDQLQESTQRQPMEPRADEIARTIELELQLSEIVQTASAMLDPEQAQELLSRADGWSQNGFDCPDGAGREACRQSSIRSLIKEIDNKMRRFNTEY